MRRARLLSACAAMLGALFCPSASAFDLPDGLPARADGLWRIERTETLAHGESGVEMRKIRDVCLDARADRALHMLEVYEQRASVARLGLVCDAPRFARADHGFSWTMSCTAADEARASDVRHDATFSSDRQMQAETVIVNRGAAAPSRGRFAVHMEHIGACEGMRPGDMLLRHWFVNGDESLKARQRQTVYGELDDYKARAAAGRVR